jgi:hypothetical protein
MLQVTYVDMYLQYLNRGNESHVCSLNRTWTLHFMLLCVISVFTA